MCFYFWMETCPSCFKSSSVILSGLLDLHHRSLCFNCFLNVFSVKPACFNASENFPPCASTCSLASSKFLNIFVSYFVAIFFFKDFINNHLAKRLLASALFFNLVIKSSTVIVEPFIVAISFEPLEHVAKLKRPLRPLRLRLVFLHSLMHSCFLVLFLL